MQKAFVNTFQGGLDFDTSPTYLPNNKYSDGYNITLSEDGSYGSLKALKGTTDAELTTGSELSGGTVLDSFAAVGFVDGAAESSEGIFSVVTTGSGSLREIKFYYFDPLAAQLYLMAEYVIGVDDFSIDAVKFTEGGIDTFIVTDGVTEPKKIKLSVTSGTSSTVAEYNDVDISLLQRATYADLQITDTIDGNLLCGAYQFAVRLVNQTTDTYSKWTLLSVPMNISEERRGTPATALKRIRGGYGLYSGLGIELSLDITTDESNNYEFYQLAVVEYTNLTDPTVAGLQPLKALTPATTSYTLEYKTNKNVGTVDLSELTVDKAAIKTCKTLEVKDNRLFLGNIEYHSLEYDCPLGDPIISAPGGGVGMRTTIRRDSSDIIDDDLTSSLYKGYRRGELYRFAISYFDEFYNFSRPKILDMSGLSDNTASSGIDMKFPSAKDDVRWSVIDHTTSSTAQMGLSAIFIDQHPTWAKGFVILRAKRIKRIEFQTPLIPSSYFEGVPVTGEYPTEIHDISTSSTTTFTGAQPQNPLGTVVPKNMFQTEPRFCIWDDSSLDIEMYVNKGGATPTPLAVTSPEGGKYFYIMPPASMLDTGVPNDGFSLTGQTIETADVAFLRADTEDFTPATVDGVAVTAGDTTHTSYRGTFYAIDIDDYYYGGVSGTLSDPRIDMTAEISDYAFMDNDSDGVIIDGLPVSKFSYLETSGFTWGNHPTTQRMGAIKLNNPREDVIFQTTSPSGGGTIPAGFFYGNTLSSASAPNNDFNVDDGAYTEHTTYVNAVEIVNIVNNELGDDRYGDEEEQHELISTGAYYVFSSAELSNVEAGLSHPVSTNVFGGDTYVTYASYKLSNSHYGILDDSDSNSDSLAKWDKYAVSAGNDAIQIALPYDNLSQTITVALELDERTSVLDTPAYDSSDTQFSTSTIDNVAMPIPSNEASFRSDFTYFYADAYSKENDSKVFFPITSYEDDTTQFNARVAYSNQRIYQSDKVGFDSFNSLDFYDLDEKYGQLYALELAGDNMVGFQEFGIMYLPVSASVIETADALTLSIRSAEILNDHKIITNTYGVSDYIVGKQTLSTDKGVFFVDTRNRMIGLIGGDLGLVNLSNKGIASRLAGLALSSVNSICYDSKDERVLFSFLVDGFMFNTRLGVWETRIPANIESGAYFNGSLYFATSTNDEYTLSTFNTNSNYEWFGGGIGTTPYVVFHVNESPFVSKVFDNLIINSDFPMGDLRVQGLGAGEGVTPNLTDTFDFAAPTTGSGEGSFRTFIPRDNGGSKRIRGARSLMTFNWNLSDNSKFASLHSVVTKYRESKRTI